MVELAGPARRVDCHDCGVAVAAVPLAGHDSAFTERSRFSWHTTVGEVLRRPRRTATAALPFVTADGGQLDP